MSLEEATGTEQAILADSEPLLGPSNPSTSMAAKKKRSDSELSESSQRFSSRIRSRSKGQIIVQVLGNLFNSKAAIAVQFGVLIVAASIYYSLFTTPFILFTYHPLFNSLGLAFLTQALLITQPTPISTHHKTVSGQIHGILNTIGTILFTIGVSFIVYNKARSGSDHITSWHAVFGVISFVLLVLVLLVGVAQFWLPVTVFGSVSTAKKVYRYHRLTGYFTLLIVTLTIILALDSDYNVNVLHISYFTVIPGFGLLVFGLFSRIKISKIRIF